MAAAAQTDLDANYVMPGKIWLISKRLPIARGKTLLWRGLNAEAYAVWLEPPVSRNAAYGSLTMGRR